MTVKEIQRAIRQITAEVNTRIDEYREGIEKGTGKQYDILDAHIKRLQSYGGTGRTGEIGLHFRGKKKAQLESQLQALEMFNTLDRFTPQAIEKEQKRAEKAYNSFVHDNGYISREEYDSAVTILGNLSHDIVSAYGSSNILELVKEVDSGQKHANVKQALIDVYEKSQGKGFSQEDILYAVYNRLS